MSRIKIELRSDLCTGSGYSYAGIIDSDVCYDDNGIPYIPAKRIKGCMRESLESILGAKYGDDVSKRLFGRRGANIESGALRVGNAYIENKKTLSAYIDSKKKDMSLDSQRVLDRYTHVVGQTAMKDGVADPSTLRYTRVVNMYDPCSEEPMVFYAEVSYSDEDEKIVEDILKATRHIGLKRNRGLGNVKCTLVNDTSCDDKKAEADVITKSVGDSTLISYVMENIEPLVLSAEKESDTRDYISGKMIIGMLASKYLSAGGNADSDEFRNLFIDGTTVYSHMYPCRGGKIFYPAPEYINRLKKTKKYVCTLEKTLPNPEDQDFNPEKGNQPKKLKGKYVSITGSDISVLDVERDIVYHHRHEKGNDTEMLYSVNCIVPGQKFAGTIKVKNEYADKVIGLLKGDCYFGKSRTAQYGLCRLADMSAKNADDEYITVGAGKHLVVTLCSDMAVMLDDGRYSVYYDEIREQIASLLGISYEDENDADSRYLSSIQTTHITGYMTKWNLRNEPVPAIKAGSYLVYKLSKDFTGRSQSIGERISEGYGLVRFSEAEKCEYAGLNCVEINETYSEAKCDKYIGRLLTPLVIDEWVAGIIGDSIKNAEYKNVSNSAVGRWKLMLTESIDKYGMTVEAFKEFEKRIKSIKTSSIRAQGEKLLRRIERLFLDLKDDSGRTEKCMNDLRELLLTEDEIKDEMLSRWPEYVYAVLANRKYLGGEK